jgi:predicted Rossmann-fold nucleotide-binding protein
LDELFDALTLIQTKIVKPLPVILFGEKFWRSVIDFETLVEEGTVEPEDIHLFKYTETAEDAWKIITDFYENENTE